jgi:dTDP-4-dehydrorhamnose 3,5-epimerase-like enzyme
MDYKVEKFEKHSDKRGQLVVFLKASNLYGKYKKFGQIYFITFNRKGIMRGNHFHKKWREWFGVVQGKVKADLRDVKSGETHTIILDGNKNEYIRLEIGPNILHKFTSLTSKASLVNYTDTEWSPHDTFLPGLEKKIYE